MSSSDQPQRVGPQDDADSSRLPSAVLERITDRRRAVLALLLEADGGRRLRVLAAELAAEGTADSPRTVDDAAVDRVVGRLRQVDLPALAAVDLLERDREAGTVAATDHQLYEDPRFRRFIVADADLEAAVDAFADDRRRRVFAVLEGRDAPIARADLAAEAAASLPVSASSLRVELHHVHLPKLGAAGLLSYDADDGVVAPAQPDLEPWLLELLAGR